MKVEIVSVETIKPSFPTPAHLKTHNLSLLDQLAISNYPSIIFFYPNNATDSGVDADADAGRRYEQFSKTLKNALSDTLTLFPPLAGRIKDNVSVDCDDHGVQWYETRVHSTLDALLSDVDTEGALAGLTVLDGVNADPGFFLLVQVNLFSCGGVALGFCCSHKVCDMTGFATFLRSWSAKATNSGQVIQPELTALATKIPARKQVPIPQQFPPTNHELSTVRLAFDGPKLAALKAESASQSTPQPTRVEAVSALIGKCAVTAFKANNKSYSMPYLFRNSVNMRAKLVPALPQTSFGNAVGHYNVHVEQSDTELDALVDKLRKGRLEYFDFLALGDVDKVIEKMEENNQGLLRGDTEIYRFVSWCRSGFNELDFGMGRPKWCGVPFAPFKNRVILMDADDGVGVVSLVTLTKRDMDRFRADPILLSYASVNPAI